MYKSLFLCGVSLFTLFSAAQEKPNIIYILTDQQTATAMSCMGSADVYTPNMDRLAQAGILFKNAYCAAPLSGPSRTAMFTGHFSHEIGMPSNGIPMPEDLRGLSLGMLMKMACSYSVYSKSDVWI